MDEYDAALGSPSRNAWGEILKIQLDGVMMHVALCEGFTKEGIKGMAAMHKAHAVEEMAEYMDSEIEFIDAEGWLPDLTATPAALTLKGNCKESKMMNGLSAYEDWEANVCLKLKELMGEMSEGKEYVEHLIDNVRMEIKDICLMKIDMLKGKYEELDEWLEGKYR